MNEEILEILKMVKEGKVTPEQGAELIKALVGPSGPFREAWTERTTRVYLRRPRMPAAVLHTSEAGFRFLCEFLVIGPFPLLQDVKSDQVVPQGFDRPYPPEEEINFSATYDGMAGLVGWRQASAEPDGRLDLLRYVAPSENVIAYVHALVTAPFGMQTKLAVGSNDGVKVWVNQRLAFAYHVGREARPFDDIFGVSLREGPNSILVKIENWGRRWELFLVVCDPGNVLTLARG